MLSQWSGTFAKWEAFDSCKAVLHYIRDRIDENEAPSAFFDKFLKELGRVGLFNSRMMPEAKINK